MKEQHPHKRTYASILRKRSNTNLRRSVSRENIAEKQNNHENTNNINKSLLNARWNRSTSRNRTSEVPKESAKKVKENETTELQNEIKTLKEEIQTLKKDRTTSSQIPTRIAQVKTPQKNKQVNNNNESKNGGVASTNGGQQQIQLKSVIEFIQKTMLTLSE